MDIYVRLVIGVKVVATAQNLAECFWLSNFVQAGDL